MQNDYTHKMAAAGKGLMISIFELQHMHTLKLNLYSNTMQFFNTSDKLPHFPYDSTPSLSDKTSK